MKNATSDIQFLTNKYLAARNNYKPRQMRVLLLAEAPPNNLDRYFYFEDVKTQDSLFLEIMGVLYPEQKAAYLASGRDAELKRELLETFQEDGIWLVDVSDIPLGLSTDKLETCVPHLLQQLKKYVDNTTPVVLIKANVYDLCYPVLLSNGYNVINERIPFPGSGQQTVFRKKFRKVMAGF